MYLRISYLQQISEAAPPKTQEKSGDTPGIRTKPEEFPQFFPQVWKTLGRDQTRMVRFAADSTPRMTWDFEKRGRRL